MSRPAASYRLAGALREIEQLITDGRLQVARERIAVTTSPRAIRMIAALVGPSAAAEISALLAQAGFALSSNVAGALPTH